MKTEDKTQLVAAGGVGIAGAVITGGALPIMGIVPLTLKALVMELRERSERRFWIDVVEKLEKRGGAEVRDKIESLIFDINSQENTLKVIATAWRSLMESNDPCVGPALSVLAAMYFNTPPDSFFRGLCRVLVELDFSEFTELRRLLSAVVALPPDVKMLYIDYKPGRTDALDAEGKPMSGVWLHDLSSEKILIHLGGVEHIERLCYLLKNNGFELPPSVTRWASRPAYGVIQTYLSREVAGKIVEVIGLLTPPLSE